MRSWQAILARLRDHEPTPDLAITQPLQVHDWDRRSFLKLLLATPLAATVDVEALIWTPKPIVLVSALPRGVNPNLGAIVAAAWEEVIGKALDDRVFSDRWLFDQLSK